MIAIMRKIARSQNVGMIVTKRVPKTIDGYFLSRKGKIVIKSTLTKRALLLTFFHELAHSVAYNRGFWKDFHEGKWGSVDNSYAIEQKIEQIAVKLWNKHIEQIPGGKKLWGKYEKTYNITDMKHIKEVLGEFFIGTDEKYILSKEQIREDAKKLLATL